MSYLLSSFIHTCWHEDRKSFTFLHHNMTWIHLTTCNGLCLTKHSFSATNYIIPTCFFTPTHHYVVTLHSVSRALPDYPHPQRILLVNPNPMQTQSWWCPEASAICWHLEAQQRLCHTSPPL